MMRKYTLTRPQSAAAIIVALGRARAARVLKGFKSDELRVVMDSAQTLKTVSRSELEGLIKQFEQEFINGVGLMDSGDQLNDIFSEALTEEEMERLHEKYQSVTQETEKLDVWAELAKLDDAALVAFLVKESDQVCAIILNRLTEERVAALLQLLPEDKRSKATARLFGLKPIAPEVMAALEERLKDHFRMDSPSADDHGQLERLAAIINEMSGDAADALMRDLATKLGQDKVDALEKMIFRFEDVVKLSAETRTLVFDGMPAEVIAKVLSDADDEMKEAILSSVGQRSRRMIESELEGNLRIPPAQLREAKKSIASLVLKMANEGKIEIKLAA